MMKNLKKKIADVLGGEKRTYVLMIEIPAEEYLTGSMLSMDKLLGGDYQGIYVSFQRPEANVREVLQSSGLDPSKVAIIDVATLIGDSEGEVDIDVLVGAIYDALSRITSKNRFIFIDSLATLALYRPLSEILRFSEFLIHAVRETDSGKHRLIINVPRDLSRKRFIRDVALKVDNVVTLGEA